MCAPLFSWINIPNNIRDATRPVVQIPIQTGVRANT